MPHLLVHESQFRLRKTNGNRKLNRFLADDPSKHIINITELKDLFQTTYEELPCKNTPNEKVHEQIKLLVATQTVHYFTRYAYVVQKPAGSDS